MMRVVVLGAGPGGYVAALRTAQLGAEVTVVERGAVGGVCLNRGCIPTKTLLAAVNALRSVREVERYGVSASEPQADWLGMLAVKERVVANLRKGVEHLLKKNKVKLVSGFARFRSRREVEVEGPDRAGHLIEADRVIIATGSSPQPLPAMIRAASSLPRACRGVNERSNLEPARPALPSDPDSDQCQDDCSAPAVAPYLLTSDECLELRAVPASLMIIGGGAIGVEFAYIFAGLGAQVTLVEMMPRILPAEDGDVSEELARELRRLKIRVMTDCRLEGIVSAGTGSFQTRLSSGDTASVSAVLVAVGRRPNSADLNLDAAGVHVDALGRVTVNEKMETSAAGIYAIGDVAGGMLLAHKASAEGIVAAENAFGANSRIDYNSVPRCIFTEPQSAAVGLTEEEAKTKGLQYRVGKVPFRAIGKAHAVQKTAGFAKIIAEQPGGRLLGAHMVGHGVAEMIHEVALALRLGLDVSAISSTVHAHPTLSEAIYESALAAQGRALHV